MKSKEEVERDAREVEERVEREGVADGLHGISDENLARFFREKPRHLDRILRVTGIRQAGAEEEVDPPRPGKEDKPRVGYRPPITDPPRPGQVKFRRLDGKVHGTLVSNRTGEEIPPDEYVVFRPHDDALVETLYYYRNLLVPKGASREQLEAVDSLIARVEAWREAHPERRKVPDVEPGEIVTS